MTAPAPGTSSKLLTVGGVSAGVGLLIKLIVPLTYTGVTEQSTSSWNSPSDLPWQMKKVGSGLLAFLGAPADHLMGLGSIGGIGLADFGLILGAVAIALAIAIRGFEPRVPRPVAPQGYPQYPGQYAQPQPGQYAAQPGQYSQPGLVQPGQPDQAQAGQPVAPDQAQAGQPVAPDQAQAGQPAAPDQTQQQWSGPSS